MNEFDFIQSLREQASSRKHSTRLIKGIGDDACVVGQAADRELLVTSDLLIEDIDFYPDAAPAKMLGHKSLAVSLSDIAAMGGRPLWSLLSIGMTNENWHDDFKDEFFKGYLELADQYGVTLAGGDVSRTKTGIVIDSIVLGEVSKGSAILRSGARPGDQIYVTGTLGGAAAGLKLIEMGARLGEAGLTSLPRASGSAPGAVTTESAEGARPTESSVPGAVATGSGDSARAAGPSDQDSSPSDRGSSPTVREGAPITEVDNPELRSIQQLLQRHLRPSPRVGWGIVLGEGQLATSMIDISDGLSSDLAHLCKESNTGALIDAAALPIDPDVSQLCGRRALDPLLLALHGGEDFELLFTVPPENVSRLPRKVDGVPICRIGEFTEQAGKIRVEEKNRVWDLKAKGFEHFGDSR